MNERSSTFSFECSGVGAPPLPLVVEADTGCRFQVLVPSMKQPALEEYTGLFVFLKANAARFSRHLFSIFPNPFTKQTYRTCLSPSPFFTTRMQFKRTFGIIHAASFTEAQVFLVHQASWGY